MFLYKSVNFIVIIALICWMSITAVIGAPQPKQQQEQKPIKSESAVKLDNDVEQIEGSENNDLKQSASYGYGYYGGGYNGLGYYGGYGHGYGHGGLGYGSYYSYPYYSISYPYSYYGHSYYPYYRGFGGYGGGHYGHGFY